MGSEDLDNSGSFVADVGKSVSAKVRGILHSVLGTAKGTVPIAGKGATDIQAALDIVNRPTFRRELPSRPAASNLEVQGSGEDDAVEPQKVHGSTEEQVPELCFGSPEAENLEPETEKIFVESPVDTNDGAEIQAITVDMPAVENPAETAEEEEEPEISVAEEIDDPDDEETEDEVGIPLQTEESLEENRYRAPQTVETSAACAERSCTRYVFDPDAYMWEEEEIEGSVIDPSSVTRTEPVSDEESPYDIVRLSSEESLAEETHAEDAGYIPNIIHIENPIVVDAPVEIEVPAEVTYMDIGDEVEGMVKIVMPEITEDEIETEDSRVSEIETEEADDCDIAFCVARTEFPLTDVSVEEYTPIFSLRDMPVTEGAISEDPTEALAVRDYVEDAVADDIVNRILVELVPEIFGGSKTIGAMSEVSEDPDDSAITDIIEDIVAETVVNDVMTRLVPEVFASTEEIAEGPIPAVVSHAVEGLHTGVSTGTEIKLPVEDIPEAVGTTIKFMFPFAAMSLNDGTGFRFTMGTPEEVENDVSAMEEMSELDSRDSSESIYVVPVRGGSTFTL